MPDGVRLTVDGVPLASGPGITVAAALWNAGERRLRRSVSGEPRGVLCAMGICFECRVTIDGVAHRRACMELVRDGMDVVTGFGESPVPGPASGIPGPEPEAERIECDVAVVGAGPAGVAAACRAAEAGARTLLVDDGAAPGGQIHRRLPSAAPPEAARAWLERLAHSGATTLSGATVAEAAREEDESFTLLVERGGAAIVLAAKRLVLATGARELFLPFPGWTLPGVMGVGAVQALAKSGASISGRVAVVAGSGPLLLPVAAHLSKAGAEVALVAEQAGLGALVGFGAALLSAPGKLVEAAAHRSAFSETPYRTGTWIAEARGSVAVESVVLSDGRDRYEIACDLAAVSHGLVPNAELARLLGCAVRGGVVAVNERQETSVPGVLAAGETCGVAGAEVAVAEGEIAGLAAAGRGETPAAATRRARARGRALARRMAHAFHPRPELRGLARPDTVVCRCEDVRLAAVAACGGPREAKLAARAGMGPCQARVCGPALEFLFGWDSDTVRPPARPVPLGHLAAVR